MNGAARFLIALGISALAFLITPLTRDLWMPYEPTIALAGLEVGDYPFSLMARMDDDPQKDYGPLYFWSVYASSKIFGTSGATYAFVPSGLACLMTALLLWGFGSKRIGWTAIILFASTPMVLWYARSVLLDIFLLPTTFAGLCCFFKFFTEGTRHKRYLIGGFVCGFLGWAVKGPIGLALPIAGALMFLILERRWRGALKMTALSVIVSLTFAAAWYGALAAIEGQEMTQQVIRAQILSRVLPGNQTEHSEPIYYFVPIVLGQLAPWTLILIPAILGCRNQSASTRYWGAASLGIFLLFSLPACKRMYYTVPLIPPLCLFMAGWLESASPRQIRWVRGLMLAGGIALALTDLVWWSGLKTVKGVGEVAPSLQAIGAVLAIAMIAVGARAKTIVPWFAGAMGLAFAAFLTVTVPLLDQAKSMRLFLQQARTKCPPNQPLVACRSLISDAMRCEDRSIAVVDTVEAPERRPMFLFIRARDLNRIQHLKYEVLAEHKSLGEAPSDLFVRIEPGISRLGH